LAFRIAIFDRYVLAFDIPAVSEASPERRYELGPIGGGGGVEKPDHRHCQLLRPRRERPHDCRAAEPSDEFAPSKAKPHLPLPCEAQAGGHCLIEAD